MTAINENTITDEMGFTLMNDAYSEIDDKICTMVENTDKMLEFLENIKEHHEELDLDKKVVNKYVFEETLKYQRLSAEVLALSIYVDALYEEYGLLDDLDGNGYDYDDLDEEWDVTGDDEDLDDESEEGSEDSEESEDDEEPEVYESEITFRDKLFGATDVEVVDSMFKNAIDMHIDYEVSGYTGSFALRCLADGSFEYGYIGMDPEMSKTLYTWSKLEMNGFIGIMKTKCPDNPFFKWYTSEDGYPKYLNEWTQAEDEAKLTFKDKLFAATSYELNDVVFDGGIDLCITFTHPVSGEIGHFGLRCLKDGSFEYGYAMHAPAMIDVVDKWTKEDIDAMISDMKTACPNNPVLGWFTRSDGYDKYKIEWLREAARAKHAEQ